MYHLHIYFLPIYHLHIYIQAMVLGWRFFPATLSSKVTAVTGNGHGENGPNFAEALNLAELSNIRI